MPSKVIEMTEKSLQGFKVVEVKISPTSESVHHIFVKKHSVRQQTPDKPAGRTLFVLNVPPYVDGDRLKSIFNTVGQVNNVIVQNSAILRENETGNKLGGYNVAFIIYKSSQSLEKLLKLNELPPLSTPTKPLLTGLKKYINEYNSSFCDHEELQKEADKYMAKYDKIEEQKKKSKKDKDKEGWTVVGKKRKKNVLARKESAQNKALNKLKKKQPLTDFYTFQKREAKMKQISEMRIKYEEDKKRVETMKQARRFRPY